MVWQPKLYNCFRTHSVQVIHCYTSWLSAKCSYDKINLVFSVLFYITTMHTITMPYHNTSFPPDNPTLSELLSSFCFIVYSHIFLQLSLASFLHYSSLYLTIPHTRTKKKLVAIYHGGQRTFFKTANFVSKFPSTWILCFFKNCSLIFLAFLESLKIQLSSSGVQTMAPQNRQGPEPSWTQQNQLYTLLRNKKVYLPGTKSKVILLMEQKMKGSYDT